jgi:hypothetical protein
VNWAAEIPSEILRGIVNRLLIAFVAYVVLGLLTYTTISDERIRLTTFAILALFAVKTWLHRNDARDGAETDENGR